MIVYIDKNRYTENLEERLYSQLEERFYGKNVAAGVNKRVGNSYRPKQNPNPKPKNQGGIQNQGQNQNLNNQNQSMNQTQNMNIQNQPQNQNIQSQNQGNSADTKPPIVSTEQKQKATEITSVANNSADAAKNPAIKKTEEQASKNSLSTEQMNKMQANAADISKNKAGGEGQQLSLFDQQTPDNTQQPPVEPVKPTEPVKPVETQQSGSGAGDTSGGAATTDTAATTTTNTNTTNTNEEKKKGMGIGGKIALGAAGTIGIGAMGYAMGSGNNKDDDKR